MPHILCRVVWATEYRSKDEKFFAGNMKYPAKHKTAHELLNFANEDGYTFGFVEHNQSWIKIDNLGARTNDDSVEGVTVIWSALDPTSRELRVVGWYDNATVYRQPQQLRRGGDPDEWTYQFRTESRNACLLPTSERFLSVPTRIGRADKGYIGQRNWHFPDGSTNYERFLGAFGELKASFGSDGKRQKSSGQEFEEGQRSIAEISLVVRNPKLVAAAKAKYGYRCQVCDFNYEERYGDIGKNFIEVHHIIPIAGNKVGARLTSVEDVRVVCANCHRMIHRRAKALDTAELKKMLR